MKMMADGILLSRVRHDSWLLFSRPISDEQHWRCHSRTFSGGKIRHRSSKLAKKGISKDSVWVERKFSTRLSLLIRLVVGRENVNTTLTLVNGRKGNNSFFFSVSIGLFFFSPPADVKNSFLDMSNRENKDRRTLYCGNLHEHVTEEILFELFLQVEYLVFSSISLEGNVDLHCLHLDGSPRNGGNQTWWPPFIWLHYFQTRRISSLRRGNHGERLSLQSTLTFSCTFVE